MPVSLLITGYYRHPKMVHAVATAGPWAETLWCRGLDYCAEHGTNGHLPLGSLDMLGVPDRHAKKAAAALVSSGLWHRHDDGSHTYHDYLEWNRHAAELEQRRREKSEAKSRAGKAGAAARWGSRLHQPATEPHPPANGTAIADAWHSDSPGPGPGSGPVLPPDENEEVEVQNVRATLRRVVGDDWGLEIPDELRDQP